MYSNIDSNHPLRDVELSTIEIEEKKENSPSYIFTIFQSFAKIFLVYTKRFTPFDTEIFAYEDAFLKNVKNYTLKEYLVKRKTRLTFIILLKIAIFVANIVYESRDDAEPLVLYFYIILNVVSCLNIGFLIVSRVNWSNIEHLKHGYIFVLFNTSIIFIFLYVPVYKFETGYKQIFSSVSFLIVIVQLYLPYLLLMRLLKNASIDLYHKFGDEGILKIHLAVLLISCQFYIFLFILPFQWAQIPFDVLKPEFSYVITIFVFEFFNMFLSLSRNFYVKCLSYCFEIVSIVLIIVVLNNLGFLGIAIRTSTTTFITGLALRSYVRDTVLSLGAKLE